MGFCCSKPIVDDEDNEHAALLHEVADEAAALPASDRFANMDPEEAARVREEERLKIIEQETTEFDYMHGHASMFNGSGGSRDYADILRRFNQQIKLPMVTLTGPVEEARRGSNGLDVFGILADAHISAADIRLIDQTINSVLDAISEVCIAQPGECVVPLSVDGDEDGI
ncbi:hypothetical protein LPJ64_003190 [Coemansia asiatica]|uniref:Uncharacterized protein n=1 Tax=Coemansia asiatica TaxID=1052880 RepID=A0A9W7XKP5_9FUNG|nr:hypothetical protein LPJ64_003190 [Coemansia asiatica]